MVRQTVKNNTCKSQRVNQIKVVSNWQHTDEASPVFKRLMMLLLKPRGNHLVETLRADEGPQNEQ